MFAPQLLFAHFFFIGSTLSPSQMSSILLRFPGVLFFFPSIVCVADVRDAIVCLVSPLLPVVWRINWGLQKFAFFGVFYSLEDPHGNGRDRFYCPFFIPWRFIVPIKQALGKFLNQVPFIGRWNQL